MKIQQLRYVVATSKLGTMTAAADALHIAQPALSRAVRALESELRVTIFEKDGRGLRLTAAGRDVITVAARILAEVDHLESLSHAAALRVCATKAQARELGVPATKTASDRGERVLLHVVDSRDEVFAALRDRQAELGLVELPTPTDLVAVPLGWQEFVLCYPPEWDLPNPLPARDLHRIPLVAAPMGDWRHDALVCGLRAIGVEPAIAAETSERDLLGQMIAAGTGAAFLYGRQAMAACATGAASTSIHPMPVREVGVALLGPATSRAGRFLDVLRGHAADVLLATDDPRLPHATHITGPLLLRRPGEAPHQ